MAPDGEETADSVASNANASAYIAKGVPISPSLGDYYTFSVHIKKDASAVLTKFEVTLYNITNDIGTVIEQVEFKMNTLDGTLTLISTTSQGPLGEYGAEVLGITLEDGWWRVHGTLKYFAVDSGGLAPTEAELKIYPALTAADKTVVLWGAQLLANNEIQPYSPEAGIVYNIDSASGNSIVVNGDLATTPFWVGEHYLMQYQFSELNMK